MMAAISLKASEKQVADVPNLKEGNLMLKEVNVRIEDNSVKKMLFLTARQMLVCSIVFIVTIFP